MTGGIGRRRRVWLLRWREFIMKIVVRDRAAFGGLGNYYKSLLCYHYGMERLRWMYYEYKRLKRLARPEASARALVEAVGPFWLIRHGARREFKIKLWSTGKGWYAVDLAIPHKLKAIEADGGIHRGRRRQDVVRDHRLGELGWEILRIDDEETKRNPRAVKRRVRAFIKK